MTTAVSHPPVPGGSPRTARPATIDLSGADLGLPTPRHVREAAKQALDAGATHYTTRPGLDALRQAVAEKLQRVNGLTADPAREVLITCGTQEALFVTLHALLQPGDQILVPQPANPAYSAIARQARAHVLRVPGDPAAGFAFEADDLLRKLTRRTRALLLASPATPGGSVLDPAALERIASIAIARDLLVIADESYEAFVFDGAAHHSIGAVPGMAERTITINGFSRPYAMHGWRVGYLAGPARLIGPIMQLKQALSICSPAVSQYAALAALTGPRTPITDARCIVAERRAVAFAALDAAGIPHLRPAAGYMTLLDCSAIDRSASALSRRIAAQTGVKLGSGAPYGAITANRLVLSLTQPAPLIEEAIGRLRPLLVTHPA
ncbi:MAG TPA: pyridoxal phosphate-dependent aminotransferase [Chloroflexota bacterium]|nr:pyridoxal phosphate-dependent aminotransferase [Chloroflexota bacterium]